MLCVQYQSDVKQLNNDYELQLVFRLDLIPVWIKDACSQRFAGFRNIWQCARMVGLPQLLVSNIYRLIVVLQAC